MTDAETEQGGELVRQAGASLDVAFQELLAIGQATDLDFLKDLPELEVLRGGWIKADPLTLHTTVSGVFAGDVKTSAFSNCLYGGRNITDVISSDHFFDPGVKRRLGGFNQLFSQG